MKKVIALILIVIMCFSLVACGSSNENKAETKTETSETKQPLFKDPKQEAFEISKEAYKNINESYIITDEFASDFYTAWMVGGYEGASVIDGGCAYLASRLNYISEDEIRDGVVNIVLSKIDGKEWDEISEERKEEYRKNADVYFEYNKEKIYLFCERVVRSAYQVNGKAMKAQEELDRAKELMKMMTRDYADYEYYPSLKGYYTTTSSLLDFCVNTTGSFNQAKETLNNYRNEIRDYQNDLDFIFED